MNYIYQSQKVELYIDVYKGQSAVKEDFSRADLAVFLVHGVSSPLSLPLFDVHVMDNRTLKATTMNLPVGVYHLKLVWGKNSGRSPMMAESSTLFAVTEYADEATNPAADLARVKVTIHTATYGYDGMSAYELSVWHGKTILSEEEWLNRLNVEQPFISLVSAVTSDGKPVGKTAEGEWLVDGRDIIFTFSKRSQCSLTIDNSDDDDENVAFSEVESTDNLSVIRLGVQWDDRDEDLFRKVHILNHDTNGRLYTIDLCICKKLGVVADDISLGLSYDTIKASGGTVYPTISFRQVVTHRYSHDIEYEETLTDFRRCLYTIALPLSVGGTISESNGSVTVTESNTGQERVVCKMTASATNYGKTAYATGVEVRQAAGGGGGSGYNWGEIN